MCNRLNQFYNWRQKPMSQNLIHVFIFIMNSQILNIIRIRFHCSIPSTPQIFYSRQILLINQNIICGCDCRAYLDTVCMNCNIYDNKSSIIALEYYTCKEKDWWKYFSYLWSLFRFSMLNFRFSILDFGFSFSPQHICFVATSFQIWLWY